MSFVLYTLEKTLKRFVFDIILLKIYIIIFFYYVNLEKGIGKGIEKSFLSRTSLIKSLHFKKNFRMTIHENVLRGSKKIFFFFYNKPCQRLKSSKIFQDNSPRKGVERTLKRVPS